MFKDLENLVAGLLHSVELSTKNIQIFIKNNFFVMNEELMYKNVMKKKSKYSLS